MPLLFEELYSRERQESLVGGMEDAAQRCMKRFW
jgi:hypothetical protein